MRNIKISFQHPNFIYPFKCNLAPTQHQDQRINQKQAEQSLLSIQQAIILSAEEEKILMTLPLVFKAQFVNAYKKMVAERRSKDFLGQSYQQHYEYFAKQSNQKIKMKEILELTHFLSRITPNTNNNNFQPQKWLILAIVLYTNFITLQEISNQAQNLQIFVGLNLTIQAIQHIIRIDEKAQAQFMPIIPTIQDTIIKSYLNIHNLHLQQYTMVNILQLARAILNYQKKNVQNQRLVQGELKNKQKKKIDSVIYWIINFNVNIESQQEYIVSNSHTFLQLISRILPKSVNIAVIDECVSFVNLLFKEYSTFGELLFLITEAMRLDFPHSFNLVLHKIKIRQIKSANAMKFSMQIDMADLFQKTMTPLKLKQMIKFTKIQEKMYNNSIREVHKCLLVLGEQFGKYQKGKITFRRKSQKEGRVSEETEERQIMNIERLTQENHHKLKSQQIISIELLQHNQELIKVNKWLQEKLKNTENVLAELVSINLKQNLQQKLKTHSSVIKHKIHPSISPLTAKNHPQLDHSEGRPMTQKHLKEHVRDGVRQSSTHNRKSFYVSDLDLNLGKVQIPRIDIPRQSNGSSLMAKEMEMNKTKIIFQEAANKIHKNIEDKEKEYQSTNQNAFILPPLPPAPFLNTSISLLPPPLMSNLSMPPPPFLPMPPLLTGLGLPPLLPGLGLPPSLDSNTSIALGRNEMKLEMKHIGWAALDKQFGGESFWKQVQTSPFPINQTEIIKLFSKKEKNYVPLKQKLPQNKTILKPDRLKNIEIILKKIKITEKQFQLIGDAFTSYNTDFLEEEFLIGLLNSVPSVKEKQEYMSINGQREQKWTTPDKFLHFISRIPFYEQKIQSILFKYEFPDYCLAFFSKIDEFIQFFQDLKNDLFFHRFLEALLHIGNFLNAHTNKGNMKAFRIQSIQKTYLLISQDKETTLFDYILQQIQDHHPQLLECQTLLPRSRNIVSLPILSEDYNYFEKKLFRVNKCILISEHNPLDESATFFLPFYVEAKEKVVVMKKKLQLATVLFKNVKQFYGDKLESQEMARFITDFRHRVNEWKSKRRPRHGKEER